MKGPYITILMPFFILTVKNQLTLCYDPPPPPSPILLQILTRQFYAQKRNYLKNLSKYCALGSE